jgi:hypothetical protein
MRWNPLSRRENRRSHQPTTGASYTRVASFECQFKTMINKQTSRGQPLNVGARAASRSYPPTPRSTFRMIGSVATCTTIAHPTRARLMQSTWIVDMSVAICTPHVLLASRLLGLDGLGLVQHIHTIIRSVIITLNDGLLLGGLCSDGFWFDSWNRSRDCGHKHLRSIGHIRKELSYFASL